MQQANKAQLAMFLYIYSKEISSKRKINNCLNQTMTDEKIAEIQLYTRYANGDD
ncbi:MAG: hypothetical protein ABFC28_01465 [Rikenellaceae bacterium]